MYFGEITPNFVEQYREVNRQTRGKAHVALTFRLLDKKGVSNFGVRWIWQTCRRSIWSLPPTSGKPEKWQAGHQGVLEAGFARW